MFGFLNVFVAAALARKGLNERELVPALEERVRRKGSFDEAMAEFAQIQVTAPDVGKQMEPHLEFFRAERKSFAAEFKGQAYLTTDRMLTGFA